MRNLRRIFYVSSVALLAISCVDKVCENFVSSNVQDVVIQATSEDFGVKTRTERQEDGKVFWTPGDAISLFYGSGNDGGNKFNSACTEKCQITNFTGSIDISGGGATSGAVFFCGVYPYSSSTSCSDEHIYFVLPSEQKSAEGTFSAGQFPSVGRSQGLQMAFYNICGGIKFTVAKEGIMSLTFRNVSGESICGNLCVSLDSDGYPVVESITDGCDTIVVTPESGGAFKTGVDYYVTIPPVTMSSGLEVTYETKDSYAVKIFTNGTTIKRAFFNTLKDKDANLTFESKALTYSYAIVHKDRLELATAYRTTYIDAYAGTDASICEQGSPALLYSESLDLKDYVETYSAEAGNTASKLGLTPSYTFEFAGMIDGAEVTGLDGLNVPYVGADGMTNQNAFVTLTSNGIMAVNHNYVYDGMAAVNRTPLVKVTSKLNGKVVAVAYIKIAIYGPNKLKSLRFIPNWMFEGLGAVAPEYSIALPSGRYGSLEFYSSTPFQVSYKFSPADADLSMYDFQFVSREVYTGYGGKIDGPTDTGDDYSLINIIDAPVVKGDIITFTLVLNRDAWSLSPGQNNNIAALEAIYDEETVVSDYIYVGGAHTVVKDYAIVHKDNLPKGPLYFYRDEFVTNTETVDADKEFCPLGTPVLPYKATLNLNDYVETYGLEAYYDEIYPVKPASELGLTVEYKFEFAGLDAKGNEVTGMDGTKVVYKGADDLTNQNAFVTLSEDGIVAVNHYFVPDGIAAVNRTPLVKVTSFVNGVVVAKAYIKIRIVPEIETKDRIVIPLSYSDEFVYEDLTSDPTTGNLKATWPDVNNFVLDFLGLTYFEFMANYDPNNLLVLVNQLPNDVTEDYGEHEYISADEFFSSITGVSYCVTSPKDWAIQSKILSLGIDNKVKAPAENTIVFVYAPVYAGDPYVGIRFSYSISEPKN